MNVPEALRQAATIYEDRNALYGDNYKHIGKILLGLFPRGFVIQTEEEANRLHLIMHIISKLSRYCQNLKGDGHEDSLKDLSVYAMMALECDIEFAGKKKPAPVDPPSPPRDTSWRGIQEEIRSGSIKTESSKKILHNGATLRSGDARCPLNMLAHGEFSGGKRIQCDGIKSGNDVTGGCGEPCSFVMGRS